MADRASSPAERTLGRKQGEPAWPAQAQLALDRAEVTRGSQAILKGVSFVFEPDAAYVIMGRSGSGKSTLLRLLNRLEDPSRGSVRLGELRLSELPAQLVRRKIGLVFQRSRPLEGTVEDNLLYPLRTARRPAPARSALSGALEECGLGEVPLDRPAGALSGGEQQRLALATALRLDPEILLIDEPTAALDVESGLRIIELLARLRREHSMRMITVTHARDQAALLGERALVLEKGAIVAAGPVREIVNRLDDSAWSSPSAARTGAP